MRFNSKRCWSGVNHNVGREPSSTIHLPGITVVIVSVGHRVIAVQDVLLYKLWIKLKMVINTIHS